ncbi:2-dehydropantoate 2-reductase [Nocardia seriolae]|uniref:2-dehydropantoate 2-reductase n=1 Tax=Nocardia seriolae TaxID=37332 RepID=A0ABC8AYH4_9NOCA|nr:2-dehydropantoate 2-reductase [Nocardia seriolae]APA99125.1 2-dehydropantoate 2-reductase [Nocardia seriolae]WKY49323.1 2-dehydropantoate 2-reductase [Nocardia seriolae]WNJ62453.1 2-dehydropantoate 2-reductase [Nocardia seriolae]BAW06951.1 2-dehydropantoate 2-reductase [Nocardia seriolae]
MTVLGAGSIGCFVGGRLAAAGAEVTFVGRPRVLDELRTFGLRLTDLDGDDQRVDPTAFHTATAPSGDADLVLITVKSAGTATAAAELAGLVKPGTVVISLQNGIGNDAVIREILPSCVVLAGMVMFNVVHHGQGRFHRGTAGTVDIADDPALERFAPILDRSGLGFQRHPDLLPVQWAKLLLNLNNPINALSGRPLREELGTRDYRRCLSLAQREALAAMAAARIRPARLTPLPPEAMARLLTVPDSLFRRVAAKVLAVDPVARSSMADDLAAGRKTEIPWLCGEIVSLGAMVGIPTPVNQKLIELVTAAENGDRRTWSGPELLEQLERAARDGTANKG